MVGTVGPRRAGRSRRCTGSRTAGAPWAAPCSGTCSASIARCSPGCAAIARSGPLHGIGIDSWAVDYGLLDRDGTLLGDPFSYRDRRTDGRREPGARTGRRPSTVAVTGLQQLPFNTLYQLRGRTRHGARWSPRRRLLLIPDLLGVLAHRRDRRGAHQRLDHPALRRRDRQLGRASSLGGSTSRGRSCRRCATRATVVGPLLPDVAAESRRRAPTCRWSPSARTTPPRRSSAVPAGPTSVRATSRAAPGRWSDSSSSAGADRRARDWPNFTNEGGVDGTVRFLQERDGAVGAVGVRAGVGATGASRCDLAALLAGASSAEPLRTVVDINDPACCSPPRATIRCPSASPRWRAES